MPELVLDVLIEVAAFCAGAFDFRTLVHLALSCKSIHDAVKPLLDVPILLWTDKVTEEGRRLREFLAEYDLSSHPRRETFRPLIRAWSRIQLIISMDSTLLQNIMSDTQYNRNINALFPNLIAVIQHNTAWPGKWEVALRRSIEDNLLSSVIQSTTSAFRSSTPDDISQHRTYKLLDLYASHALACQRCHSYTTTRQHGNISFGRVAVHFGSNIWSAGGTAESAFISEIPNFCELASRFSSMASSGLSVFVVEGIDLDDIEAILARLQAWMRQSSAPLSFVTVIDPIGTDSNLLVAPYWLNMAEFYSTTKLSARIRIQTPLLYWALTSIDFDPIRNEIHLARWDQGSTIRPGAEMWTESLISGMFGRRVHSIIKRRINEPAEADMLEASSLEWSMSTGSDPAR